MNAEQRSIAEVPLGRRNDGICWLVLELDSRSGGWLLFGHLSLKEASEFDSWHLTREEALEEAKNEWGVAVVDWRAESV